MNLTSHIIIFSINQYFTIYSNMDKPPSTIISKALFIINLIMLNLYVSDDLFKLADPTYPIF